MGNARGLQSVNLKWDLDLRERKKVRIITIAVIDLARKVLT